MSRQSLNARFAIRSTVFLMVVLYDLMDQRFRPAIVRGTDIRRILVED